MTIASNDIRWKPDWKVDKPELGVAILNAQEGDILIVSCAGEISQDAAERLRTSIEIQFPKLKAMILSGGLKVDGVIRGI